MKTTIDILSKHQKLLLGIAVFLSLLAVSITIDSTGVNLNLKNYPSIMILMVAIGILLVIVYMRIDKNRIEDLSHQIESLSEE